MPAAWTIRGWRTRHPANEAIGGKDALVQLAVLMAATERMVFGTGIANIWARSAQTTHGAAALLAQPYPGRFVLGQDKLLVVFTHATIGQGGASAIAATVREHLAAGADHVLLGQPTGTDFIAGVDHLEQLAPALAEVP